MCSERLCRTFPKSWLEKWQIYDLEKQTAKKKKKTLSEFPVA